MSTVVTSILIMVSFVVASVALKQIIISYSNSESQHAFYNADSGIECAIYWDLKNSYDSFSTTTPHTISCNNQTISAASPAVPTIPAVPTLVGGGGNANPVSIFKVDFPKGCAIIRVIKEMPANTVITTVESRGYNTCDTTALRRFERGITITY